MASAVNLLPQSYGEECKRLLTYLAESEHIKMDGKKNEVVIHRKTYNLVDLTSDLIANCKRLASFDKLFQIDQRDIVKYQKMILNHFRKILAHQVVMMIRY